MPAELPNADLEAAEAAIQFARLVRKTHARRSHKTSSRRIEDIRIARQRLKETMRPLRTHIGQFPVGPQTGVAEANRQRIRDVSAAMQAERRKLTKMSPPTKKEPETV
jgi:hypothetical protein